MKNALLFLPVLALWLGTACLIAPEGRVSPQQILPQDSQTPIISAPPVDVPKYSLEKVLSIAKALSPDCRIQTGTTILYREDIVC